MQAGESVTDFDQNEDLSFGDVLRQQTLVWRAGASMLLEDMRRPLVKVTAATCLAVTALAGCSINDYDSREYYRAEHQANADAVKRNAENGMNAPEDPQPAKDLRRDLRTSITGRNDAEWDASVAGSMLNDLDGSDSDRFTYSGHKGEPAAWKWQNSIARNGRSSEGIAVSAEYGDGSLHLMEAMQFLNGRKVIGTEVTIKTEHLQSTEPDYGASRQQWLNWFSRHAGELSVSKLHGEDVNAAEPRKADVVDLWVYYKGSSTKPSALQGYSANGVSPKDSDGHTRSGVQVYQAALDEFKQTWDRIDGRPVA